MKKSILAFLALTLISAQSFAGNNGEGRVITLLKPLSLSNGTAISSEGRSLGYVDIDKNSCYLHAYNKNEQDADLDAGSKLIISEVKSDIMRTENLHALGVFTVKMSPQGNNSILFDLTCRVEGFSKVAVSKKLADLNKAVKAYGTILKLE